MAQHQQPQGLHSLSTIIKRLEAVTSRLEDVAISQQSYGQSSLRSATSGAHEGIAGAVAAGSAPATAPATPTTATHTAHAPPPPPPPPPAAQEELSPAIKAYKDEIDPALDQFIGNSKKVGGLVEQHSALVAPLVEAQYAYLKMASSHGKPDMSALSNLLKPQADAIGAIMQAKDKLGREKEGREWGPALSVLGEGAGAWGWVQVEPAPAPFVGEMKASAQFWVDRVIKQFKESKPEAVEWARSFSALLDALQKYVKQWHTTGVAWKPNGPPAPSSVPSASGLNGSTAGAPPPPPPPPANPQSAGSSDGGGGGHAALFASLNKGEGVTTGLRKVDSSMQTHKNPELRASSVVPDRAGSVSPNGKRQAPPIKAKPASFSKAPAKNPPKTELEGNKWNIEYHEDNKQIEITDTALHHTVHLYACKNSVVRIHGKINAVTMVNCKKTSLVVDSVVSSLSVTSSPSFEMQVTGAVQTIMIDTTDSGQVYLSKECMDTVEIVTSKTSAINISIPAGEEGDYVERPVPEQMKSRVINGRLVTEIVEHAG